MARTSKLTQLKNSYNAQIVSLRAQLAESRLAYFAHGERVYFFMLFIILFLVGISLLIAWAAGAFDTLDNAVEDGDAVKTCGDGKVCDKGFTCTDGVCKENAKDGGPCEGVQVSDCQVCDDGKARKTKFFEGSPKCWKGEWGLIFGILAGLIIIGVGIYYKKGIMRDLGRFKLDVLDIGTRPAQEFFGIRDSDAKVFEEILNDPTLLAGSKFETDAGLYNVPDLRYDGADYYEAINVARRAKTERKSEERKRKKSLKNLSEAGKGPRRKKNEKKTASVAPRGELKSQTSFKAEP